MATPTTGECIPGDLLTEILIRLPVKSILCCKSVSKPWLSLISNPNFIKSHLKHTLTKPGGDQTVIVKDEDDFSPSVLHLDSPQIQAPLGLPFFRGNNSFNPDFEFVFSSSGLLCVSANDRNNPDTFLWNPATKRSKLIPPHNLRLQIRSVAMGFGFDPIGNDFKVVRVVAHRNPKPRAAEVYSANTNVWRQVKPRDFPENGDLDFNVPGDYPEDDVFDICVNGFLCCLGLYGMMAFDLHTEVFTPGINLPNGYFTYCITDFNDSIAVITSGGNQLYQIKLWTLDNEACLRGGGVEAVWNVMLTVNVDFPVLCVFGCFNNGDFVLYDEDDSCFLYNSHKGSRNVPIPITIGRKIIKYNESLISITSFKQVDWNAHEEDS